MSINVGAIAKALQLQIQNDFEVSSFLKSEVVRGDYINEDPNNTPWIGVYRGTVRYVPRTLGVSARNWEPSPEIRVVIQDTNFISAENCEDALEEHIKLVIDAIFKDTTIGGTVDMINEINVEYLYNETDRESTYFQTAIITLKLEVATA